MCRNWLSKFIVAIPKVIANRLKLQTVCKHTVFVQNVDKDALLHFVYEQEISSDIFKLT